MVNVNIFNRCAITMDNVVAMSVTSDRPVKQQTMDLVSHQLSMKPII